MPKKWLAAERAAERAAELRKENAIDFNTLEELADTEDCDGACPMLPRAHVFMPTPITRWPSCSQSAYAPQSSPRSP